MLINKIFENIKNIYNKLVPNRIKREVNFLENYRKAYRRNPIDRTNNIIPHYIRALQWVKNNTIQGGGIIISTSKRVPYLEVTGYLIPTLIDAGEHRLAEIYAEFLRKNQLQNGAFTGADRKEYIFDSAQALRGLLAASQHWERFKQYALKTINYIISSIEENGRIKSIHENNVPEFIHIFALPALAEAAKVFNNPKYLDIAKKSVQYYKTAQNVLDTNLLTHFLAYIIDGFIDMGEKEFVRPVVMKIFSTQRKDGSIPAYPNVKWICSTGIAQFSVIGYKMGLIKEANRGINYLCSIQNPTGGFLGSYGFYADYFPIEEISWANKFFLDAIHLKISSFFDHHTSIFPKEISQDDGRVEAVFSHFGDLRGKKILDAGCGKGRFAVEIKKRYPLCEIHGLDISEGLLREVPDNIIKKKGSVLNLPYDNATFDGVLCVEVLEHAIRRKKSIRELCRVLKDNGRIVIIDKNIEKLGRLEIADFEQWFYKDELKAILKTYCYNVQVREISYEKHEADGLFLAWTGIKGKLHSP